MHWKALGQTRSQNRVDKVHEEVQEDGGGGCRFDH